MYRDGGIMSTIKMKLIDLVSQTYQIDDVLMTFVDLKGIHPVLATEIVEKVKGLTSLVSENPCRSILNELDNITADYNVEIPGDEIKERTCNFNDMYDYVLSLHEKLSSMATQINQLEENIQKYKDALIQIKNIHSLDIALDDLFSCNFVFFRFGRIPNDSLEKIKLFLNKPFIFRSFKKDHDKTWCMYYTTNEYKREVDNIFSSLLFERIMIPDFVHGTPNDAIEALESEILSIRKMIDQYQSDMKDLIDENMEKLTKLHGELIFLDRVFEFRKFVVGMGNKFSVSSFILESEIDEFKKAFEKYEDVDIEIKDAYSDGRILPPRHVKKSWFKS